ncbi:hypothetical protein P9112_012178 [Eukaryota sp. TZLM1-RC]
MLVKCLVTSTIKILSSSTNDQPPANTTITIQYPHVSEVFECPIEFNTSITDQKEINIDQSTSTLLSSSYTPPFLNFTLSQDNSIVFDKQIPFDLLSLYVSPSLTITSTSHYGSYTFYLTVIATLPKQLSFPLDPPQCVTSLSFSFSNLPLRLNPHEELITTISLPANSSTFFTISNHSDTDCHVAGSLAGSFSVCYDEGSLAELFSTLQTTREFPITFNKHPIKSSAEKENQKKLLKSESNQSKKTGRTSRSKSRSSDRIKNQKTNQDLIPLPCLLFCKPTFPSSLLSSFNHKSSFSHYLPICLSPLVDGMAVDGEVAECHCYFKGRCSQGGLLRKFNEELINSRFNRFYFISDKELDIVSIIVDFNSYVLSLATEKSKTKGQIPENFEDLPLDSISLIDRSRLNTASRDVIESIKNNDLVTKLGLVSGWNLSITQSLSVLFMECEYNSMIASFLNSYAVKSKSNNELISLFNSNLLFSSKLSPYSVNFEPFVFDNSIQGILKSYSTQFATGSKGIRQCGRVIGTLNSLLNLTVHNSGNFEPSLLKIKDLDLWLTYDDLLCAEKYTSDGDVSLQSSTKSSKINNVCVENASVPAESVQSFKSKTIQMSDCRNPLFEQTINQRSTSKNFLKTNKLAVKTSNDRTLSWKRYRETCKTNKN